MMPLIKSMTTFSRQVDRQFVGHTNYTKSLLMLSNSSAVVQQATDVSTFSLFIFHTLYIEHYV